jgi:hypothetical protein
MEKKAIDSIFAPASSTMGSTETAGTSRGRADMAGSGGENAAAVRNTGGSKSDAETSLEKEDGFGR